MNDILKGNWKQLHGQMKEWWGNLTDDDLTKIDGKRENLVGVLQTKYGYAKERAEKEVDDRLAKWQKAQAKPETVTPKTEPMTHKTEPVAPKTEPMAHKNETVAPKK